MGEARDLIILGTGVHGLEMAEIVQRINREQLTWNLLGYVAAEKQAKCVSELRCGLPVLGTLDAIGEYPDALLVPDNEFPHDIPLPRERLTSLVDPSTFVAQAAKIGPGCVIYPNGFVGHNAQLGQRVFALAGSVINHDDVLEDRVVLCSHVSLAGHVHVEADCYLGQACTVRQFVRIGRNSLIGMGSVVLRDVAANSVMVGSPARRLRERGSV
jgi:carbonic anhydrase/acetyltransferase-like protein (isoleucine patch superfamily)